MAQRQGKLVVVSAPSGTGKSTLCAELRRRHSDIGVSVSHTTRPPRGAERDGVEYYFVSEEFFERMVAAGEFLEWANVFGKRYGSSRAEVERLLAAGKDVLFDIDVQGGRQIKRARPDALLIFLLPPSLAELQRRLRGRGTESEEQIRLRLRTAAEELRAGLQYDGHVVNDDLERAIAEVDSLRRKDALALPRQDDRINELLREMSDFLSEK
jgi:guanylate kinase